MQPYRKEKLLILITKSNWGGAQRYVYDLAHALPKDRYDVVVALGGDGELKSKLTAAGITTLSIPSLQRDISLQKELASFSEIATIIKDQRPDILHVNSSKAGGIGAFLGRLYGVPKIIYACHGWAFNEDRSVLSKLVVGFFHWLTVMFAHATIAVSNTTKSQMKWPFAQRKIVVVYNGREIPEFVSKNEARDECIAIAPQLQDYRQDTWTGTIAELHPVKQHHLMIEAVEKLVAQGINIRHIVIGDGELKTSLEKSITDKGLADNVFLLGHIHEAARLLPAFDIFTLTSRSEGLGYGVIEAAQAGLPIVATNVGGIKEIISSGWDGVLVSPADATELTEALSDLIKDNEKRQKMAHAAEIRGQHFSIDRMVSDTMAVYNN